MVCFWFWREDEADRGKARGKKENDSRGPRNVGMGMGTGIILMDTMYKVGRMLRKRKRKKFAQILQEKYCMVKRKRMKQKRGVWLKRVT